MYRMYLYPYIMINFANLEKLFNTGNTAYF